MTDFISNTEDPCLVKQLTGHQKPITSLVFHPTNYQFASCTQDDIIIWNFKDDNRSYKFTGHTQAVTGVDFSYDGKILASCSKDTTVRLWVPTIKGGVTSFKAHTSAVNCISFSPISQQLITGANDKSVKVWDSEKAQFLCSFVGHNNWVKCAKYSPNGNYILSSAEDRTVRIWDTRSGDCEHIFSSKNNPTYLDIHPNNNAVAVAMDSGTVRVYDLRNKKLQQHYTLHQDSCTNCVSWHPNACYFMSCGNDGKIFIVDVMEGKPLYTLNAHQGAVATCKFNGKGNIFASGGEDSIIHLWQTNFIQDT